MSDLNVVVLLRESPEERAIIRRGDPRLHAADRTFILGTPGFERSARCFAVKLTIACRTDRIRSSPSRSRSVALSGGTRRTGLQILWRRGAQVHEVALHF